MMTAMVNHLWQSTLVAGLAWLVTLGLRRDRAAVRYGVWLAASLKFLIPFSVLTDIGARVGVRPVVVASLVPYNVLLTTAPGSLPDRAVRFSASPPAAIPLLHRIATLLPDVLLALWAIGTITLCAFWLRRYLRVAAIARQSPPLTSGPIVDALGRFAPRIAAVSASSGLEPGVFGIVSPVLVWPSTLGDHLSSSQIEAIVAHEAAHVRRRDNLAAAAHMLVQAAFWFHPLVWWIGARLVDERERACDEAVLDAGGERESYAESILKTCRLFAESPLVCVSGVTGADLKKRIENIMTSDVGSNLNAWKKCLLALSGSAALVVPMAIGVIRVEPVLAKQGAAATSGAGPAFDVVSVKPNNSGSGVIRMMPAANGGMQAENVTVGMLIRMANQVQDNQIVGGPKWIFEDRYDIVGSGSAPGREGPPLQKFKTMLEDRFKLVTHRETREQQMFALVLARPDGKLGPKMTPSTADCTPAGPNGRGRGAAAPPAPGERPRCGLSIGPGRLMVGGQTPAAIATNLSRFVGGIVVDKTGLSGTYDFELSYAPDAGINSFGRDLPPQQGAPPPPVNPDAASIFVAVQEQLGLKLEATKGPVDVIVIDSAEKPTPD